MTVARSRTYLCICLTGLLLLGTLACAAEDVSSPRAADPLLQMLERKGVLSQQDMEVLTSSGTQNNGTA